jgi:hypothetical protein
MPYQQDMSKVEKFGDLLPEGWYHVRIEKGEERMSGSNQPTWALWMKVQNEPHVGRTVWDNPSLQSHALAKLKAYYEACGYTPGPEGHEPLELNGRECWVKVTHKMYDGEKRSEIAPYNIRSMQDGPKN